MAKTRHTPGPWAWDDESDGLYIGQEKTNGKTVAVLRWQDSALDSIDTAVMRANALLIAAAPEMLAVLRALLTDNAQDSIEDPIGHAEREAHSTGTVFKGTLDAARAAIAKAEGRHE